MLPQRSIARFEKKIKEHGITVKDESHLMSIIFTSLFKTARKNPAVGGEILATFSAADHKRIMDATLLYDASIAAGSKDPATQLRLIRRYLYGEEPELTGKLSSRKLNRLAAVSLANVVSNATNQRVQHEIVKNIDCLFTPQGVFPLSGVMTQIGMIRCFIDNGAAADIFLSILPRLNKRLGPWQLAVETAFKRDAEKTREYFAAQPELNTLFPDRIAVLKKLGLMGDWWKDSRPAAAPGLSAG